MTARFADPEAQKALNDLARPLAEQAIRFAIESGSGPRFVNRQAAQASMVSLFNQFSENSGREMDIEEVVQAAAVAVASLVAQTHSNPLEALTVFGEQFIVAIESVGRALSPKADNKQ